MHVRRWRNAHPLTENQERTLTLRAQLFEFAVLRHNGSWLQISSRSAVALGLVWQQHAEQTNTWICQVRITLERIQLYHC